MARIAMVTKTYTGVTNGVVTSVTQAAQALRAQGHEVHVFAPWHPDAPAFEPGVYRLPSWRLTADYRVVKPWAWLALIGQLVLGQYHVVHVHHLPSPFCLVACLAAKLAGIPRMVTYHTYLEGYAHYVPKLRLDRSERIMAWFTTHLPKLFSVVIAPSQSIKEELQQKYHVRRRIEVIPTGIDLEQYQARASREFVQSLGIDPDQPIVMYVGRVAKEKNLGVLLRAFARIAAANSHVQLVIVGGGPELVQLKDAASELGLDGRIVFTDMVARKLTPSLFGWVTVFVSPSKSETQGITYIEAAAAGVARVAMAAKGALEAHTHDVDGWLVPLGTDQHEEDGLHEAIGLLLVDADRRARYSINARSTAVRFTAQAVGQMLDDLIQTLLK